MNDEIWTVVEHDGDGDTVPHCGVFASRDEALTFIEQYVADCHGEGYESMTMVDSMQIDDSQVIETWMEDEEVSCVYPVEWKLVRHA